MANSITKRLNTNVSAPRVAVVSPRTTKPPMLPASSPIFSRIHSAVLAPGANGSRDMSCSRRSSWPRCCSSHGPTLSLTFRAWSTTTPSRPRTGTRMSSSTASSVSTDASGWAQRTRRNGVASRRWYSPRVRAVKIAAITTARSSLRIMTMKTSEMASVRTSKNVRWVRGYRSIGSITPGSVRGSASKLCPRRERREGGPRPGPLDRD